MRKLNLIVVFNTDLEIDIAIRAMEKLINGNKK